MEDLILLVLSGEASAHDKSRLDSWRNQSPENERLFQEYARTWHVLPLHISQDPVAAPPPLERIVSAGERRRQRTIPLKGVKARRSVTRWCAAAAILIGVLSSTIPMLRGRGPDLTVSTGTSETRTVPLHDGSVVRLGPNSRLEFWSGAERRAQFSGTGFFAIAADSISPFLIRGDVGVAQVLGTRFELRSMGDSMRLVVVEGSVALSATGKQVAVGRGEMAGIRAGTPPSRPQAVDVWESLNWEDGILIFNDTPIVDVVAEVERYFGIPITIGDSTLGRRVVTAWFEHEPFDVVVGTICETIGARCILGDGLEMTR